MKIGDLVRIKQSINVNIVGKMAVVVYEGTWSRDVYIIEDGYETRIDIEKLETICK